MSNAIKSKKIISYSQFSKWFTCPQSFKLDYIDKLKKFEDNLIMSFGTAIHETIQCYLKKLYQESELIAEKFDMPSFFKTAFAQQIEKKKIPHTPEELAEFIEDGKNILGAFGDLEHRLKYFPASKYELIDIEHELKIDIKNNIGIVAYLDVVLKDKTTGKIKIIDIKTATNAWTVYQKEDILKQSQLLLYKALYSKKYNIPLSMISIEFYILRRKLYENCNYPQTHIQTFIPPNAQQNVQNTIVLINEFINECFTRDGEYRTDVKFPKRPGKNKKNCKYCTHKTVNCDMVPDVD